MPLARARRLFRRGAVRQEDRRAELPAFEHPSFDFEARIVTTEWPGCWSPPSTCRTAARTSRRRCNSSTRSRRGPGGSGSGHVARHLRRPQRCPYGSRSPSKGTQDRWGRTASRGAGDDRSAAGARPGRRGAHARPDNENLFTWWAPWRNMRQRNIGWRIDYVVANAFLAATAASCLVAADVGTSDHAPVVATFSDQISSGAR